MNKKLTPTIVIAIIGIILFAGVSCAVLYSDDNGDDIYEVNETVSFVGDDSYVDENGVDYPFTSWYWDFESDEIIDAIGKTVTHTFTKKGTYLVSLYEIGVADIIVQFHMSIIIPLYNNPDPTFKEVIQEAKDDIDVLIGIAENEEDSEHLTLANSYLDEIVNPTGNKKLLPYTAVKLAVKELEKVKKNGDLNTTEIMANLANIVKDNVEKAIKNIEEEYGQEDSKVVKAWNKFNKGLLKLEAGSYSKAIEEFDKAYKELKIK